MIGLPYEHLTLFASKRYVSLPTFFVRENCFFKVIKSHFNYETSKIVLIDPFKIIEYLTWLYL